MKAGVFSLSSNSINHSRLIKNSVSNNISSSNIRTNNAEASSQLSLINGDTSDEENHDYDDHRQTNSTTSSSQPVYSSFTTSGAAINALDEILQITMTDDSNENNDNNSEDDEDYVPTQHINSSSINKSSTVRQQPSYKKPSDINNYEARSKVVSFDVSDDDGNSIIYG